MSLSPWDLSGVISFDFDLYRPRRPSYVYATQVARRRSESYRHATKSNSDSGEAPVLDFIDHIVKKRRKDSYKQATQTEEIELAHVQVHNVTSNHVTPVAASRSMADLFRQPPPEIRVQASSVDNLDALDIHFSSQMIAPTSDVPADNTAPDHARNPVDIVRSTWRYRKNLVVLTVSFILVFTAFRSIQNLQSSLNTGGRLGLITMACVHGTMFLTCLFAPVLINKLTSKWTIVLGLLFYLFWIAANFYPHFYTLVPTSIGVGFGQSLAWGAQVTYIQKLAVDYAYETKELSQNEMYKFNGVFLACVQTSHIWGNLVSSLMLYNQTVLTPVEAIMSEDQNTMNSNYDNSVADSSVQCGVYDRCTDRTQYGWNISAPTVRTASNTVLKLMGSYLVFGFTGFVLILLFLEKIGAKSDSEKPCLQMVWNNVQQLVRHKKYRLLIPLLIFNGFEQGFVYADFNKSYITCTIGIENVGYNMITLGMTNSVFSVLIGIISRHIPREAIIGVGSVLHIGLMVFLLVWIPDTSQFPVFFVISALWGICDAIWQTQCNFIVCVCCPEDHDIAFQNFRMLQGLGAALAFFLGAVVCAVDVKLYILISLLILSILLYVVVEYQLRRDDRLAFSQTET